VRGNPAFVAQTPKQVLEAFLCEVISTHKCGRDPVVRSVSKKDPFLFKETLAHECRLLIRNSKGEINLRLKNNWKKFIKRTEIPEPERNVVTIMDRYGCDEPPTETYAGGNLAIVWLQNDERYLVHSAIEPFDCQMCLTRMTADDMKNHPLESVSTKTPFNDGTVYQIAVPHRSGCWDPSFQQQNKDPLFATRQFHTTILWKVEKRETGSLPIITNVQECSDPSSTVRYVEFNQFDWGEFCELLSQEIKISERGLLKNHYWKSLS
jgi:hypothetical protein